MAHKFDAKHKGKLDSAERRKLLPPRETLLKLGLQAGDVMADIGCGIGYFSLPAAEIAGPKGQVFALDVSQEMLEEVEKRSKEAGLPNLQTHLTEETSLKLEDASATFALLSLVLHEVEQPAQFLREINRILTKDGRLAIIEWQKVATAGGPPLDHRLAKETVEEQLRLAGFQHITTMELGEQFYTVSGQK